MKRLHFKLGGEEFELRKEDVEEAVQGLLPEEIRKHYVVVQGTKYPVKQALRLALGNANPRFISTDAIRIMQKLEFETGNIEEPAPPSRNQSELLFEQYLGSVGLGYFQYEKELKGTTRRPDYYLKFKDQEILFEVKEFKAEPGDFRPGGGAYDPYRPIREKIEAARKKFKGIKERVCCLVLFNAEKPLVHLGDWRIVYGSMLGDLAIQMPFDADRGELRSEEARTVFHKRGKMIRYVGDEPLQPQKTTISALIVLNHLPLGQRRLSTAVKQMERELGRKTTVDEFWEALESAKGTECDPSLVQLRVVAYENPFARHELTREIFRGPFDERFGTQDGMIVRVFAGEEILKLEAEEEEVSKQVVRK